MKINLSSVTENAFNLKFAKSISPKKLFIVHVIATTYNDKLATNKVHK